MTLQVTKHARMSWLTRIKGMSHATATAYTDFQKVTEDVDKTWEHAEYLTTDTIGKNPPARYFMSHDIVLVVSVEEDKLVTCYRVKYNLPNGLDETLRKGLQSAIVDLRAKVKKDEEVVNSQSSEVNTDIAKLEDDIQLMEEALKHSKKALQAKKEYVKTLDINSLDSRLELQRAVRQLINSKDLWEVPPPAKGGK